MSEPILPPLFLLPRSAEDVGSPRPVKEGQPCNAKSHPFFTPATVCSPTRRTPENSLGYASSGPAIIY